MLLRPRQKIFVERSVHALGEHGNTLAVASTGFGKTIAIAGVAGKLLANNDAKACVLAHRDELTAQNELKFSKVNPGIGTSLFDAHTKSWRGRTTFAMVPTLARQTNLDAMPALDLLVIDEAHHVAADSYRRIIDHAKSKSRDHTEDDRQLVVPGDNSDSHGTSRDHRPDGNVQLACYH